MRTMNRYAQQRIANPVYFFEKPDEVLQDANLEPVEKEQVLQSMAVDAEELVDGTDQSVDGLEPTYKAEDLRLALEKLSVAKNHVPYDHETQQNMATRFRQIVVVTTANQNLNCAALEHALYISDMSGGTVSLLNVVPPTIEGVGSATALPMSGAAPVVNVDDTEIIEDRRKLLAELRNALSVNEEVEIEVRSGHIEEEIVGYAEKVDADTIVVGSPNRSWLEGLFNPSIDHRVTKFAPCPVLVVPEPS